MNTSLNTRALALAGAVAGGLTVLACFAIYAFLGRPDPWMALFVGSGPTAGGWLIGIVEGALVGAFQGALVSFAYNWFARSAGQAAGQV